MNNTLKFLNNIEFVCNGLIKISENDNSYIVGLDVDKIGLDLTYSDILFIMDRFYNKILFCCSTKGIKSLELKNNVIIVKKW